MSEKSVVVFPSEASPIFIDDLSDSELAAFPDEEIQALPETVRKKIACRLWVVNDLRLEDDPQRMTLEQIAKRVGISVRQFLRWRTKDPKWKPMVEAEQARQRSSIDDIALLYPGPRLRELQKLYHNSDTRSANRLKVLQEFGRIYDKMGLADIEREIKGIREEMRRKVSKAWPDQPAGIRRPDADADR